MKRNTLNTTHVFMPGNSQQAVYHDSTIEEFRNNPLIETLPPLLSEKEASKRLMWLPPIRHWIERSHGRSGYS